MLDKKANVCKVQYLYGKHGCKYGRHKLRRWVCITRGDLKICSKERKSGATKVERLLRKGFKKSAEGIVGYSTRPKART